MQHQQIGRYQLRTPSDASEWAAYHRIRRSALFEPYHPDVIYDMNHPDERKSDNYPLVLIQRDSVIGSIRIDLFDAERVAFRIVAIDPDYQGQGHGTVLLRMAEDFARGQGRGKVVLHGNPETIEFYLRSGYVKAQWEDDETFGDSIDVAKDL